MIKILSRRAQIPEYDKVIGCENDNLVEERLFYVYDMSLADFDFKLSVSSGGTENIIDLDKTVLEDKIILMWTIARAHLLNAGTILAQLYAFKQAGEDIQKWHTFNIMEFKVESSIDEGAAFDTVYPSELEQMEQRVTSMKDLTIAASNDAQESKTEAANSAADAGIAKTAAENAAEGAKKSETNSKNSEINSALSESNALSYKLDAEAAKSDAQAASGITITAKDEAVSAKNAAEAAQTAAEAASVHTPYVGSNGNWFVWSTEQNKFVDSGSTSVGSKGDTGITPNIKIGYVTTVDNNDDAEVVRRSGTPNENPVLDFRLPRGVSGVYVGSGTMPDGYNVQIDPTGDMTPAITSESYDTIITEQAQFDAMIASDTWNGARNILFECGVTVTEAFTVPANVRIIEFNNYAFTVNCETAQTFNFNYSSVRNMNIFIQQGSVVFSDIEGVYNCKATTPFRDGEDETVRQLTLSGCKNIYGFTYSSNCNSFATEGVQLSNCSNINGCYLYHSDYDAIAGIQNSQYLSGCEVMGNSLKCFDNCSYIVNCHASVNDQGFCFSSCSYLSNCKAERLESDSSYAFYGTTIACDTETCLEVLA